MNGLSTLYPYIGEVDCSNVPVGEKFLIAIQAEYRDAFVSRADWWIGMSIVNPLDVASMRIIFPATLPYSNPTFRRYPNNSRLESTSFEGTVFRVPKKNPELLWRVDDPLVDNTYRVSWDWLPAPDG